MQWSLFGAFCFRRHKTFHVWSHYPRISVACKAVYTDSAVKCAVLAGTKCCKSKLCSSGWALHFVWKHHIPRNPQFVTCAVTCDLTQWQLASNHKVTFNLCVKQVKTSTKARKMQAAIARSLVHQYSVLTGAPPADGPYSCEHIFVLMLQSTFSHSIQFP